MRLCFPSSFYLLSLKFGRFLMTHKANTSFCQHHRRRAIGYASFNQHEKHLSKLKKNEKFSRIQTDTVPCCHTYAPNLSNENLQTKKVFRKFVFSSFFFLFSLFFFCSVRLLLLLLFMSISPSSMFHYIINEMEFGKLNC